MRPLVLGALAAWFVGCGSSSVSADPQGSEDAPVDSTVDDGSVRDGAADPIFDAHSDAFSDALVDATSPTDGAVREAGPRPDTTPPPTDGATPTRLPCLPRGALATDLPLDVGGALEGQLVALVPPGTGGGCPADADHLHLQVAVGAKRYDVAVTIFDSPSGAPLALLTRDLAAGPGVPLGWSGTARFDFVADLGVHSGEFTPLAKAALLARLDSELATASAVRIYGRSYTDGTGLHNVHRNGGGHDGAIVVHEGSSEHVVALRFATDTF